MKLGRRLTTALAAGVAALTVMTTVPAGAATLALPKNGDLVFVQFGGLVVVPGQTPAPYTAGFAGERPKFSPDGKKLAFVRQVLGPGPFWQDAIYVRTLATGAEQLVYQYPNATRRALDWSPDASKLVVTGLANLDVITVATGASTTIFTAPANTSVDSPAWSPDGSRIAFKVDIAIKLIHPDGTNLRTLTSSPAGTWNNYPDWSPDSQTIAFATNRFRGGALTELVTLPRSGAGQPFRVSYQAYPQGFFIVGVAWSPDGKKIAAVQSNDTLPVDPDDQDERTKVRAYLPDGTYSYSLTGPIAGDDAYEGVDWAPKVS